MKLLLSLILGGAYAFYIALLIDRPDLARAVVPPWDVVAHAAFVVLLIRFTVGASWDEIRAAKNRWANGPVILFRNLVVILLGCGLLLFTARAILYGIDQTQHRALW